MPGESGVAMAPALASLLVTLGLGNYIPIFQNNNIISLADCVHPNPQSIHPTPSTLHPITFTLHPKH